MTSDNRFDQMYKMTSLGRPIDPSYLTNLLILILAPVAGLIAGGYVMFNGGVLWIAAQTGLWTAITALVTWILAREVDPDYAWSAFVAVGFAILALIVLDFPAVTLLAQFLLVAAIRTVSRIIGPPLKIGDSIMLVAGGLLLALTEYWLLGLVIALALFLDGMMSAPVRRHLAFSALVALIVFIRGMVDASGAGTITLPYLLTASGISVLYLLTILATRKVQCEPDVQNFKLDVRRIRAAMGLALIAGFIVTIWYGNSGISAFIPLWSALLATAVYRLPVTIKEWSMFQERISS